MGAGLSRLAVAEGSRLAIRVAVLVTILLVLIIDVRLHPHYLSNFNVLAGGPDNGHRVLIDSNIDWGQDLLRLKRWMDTHDVDHLKLAWFGTADPAYYGISYDPLPGFPRHLDLWQEVPFDPEQPEPGTYAISVSNLWEFLREDKSVFSWFRDRSPDDKVGYSIFIYHVDEDG